jgi:hypothetical protein
MTAVSHISKPSAPQPVGASIMATLIVLAPIALALVCFAARLHIIELSHTVRAELLFALLIALMATGMPISIALGLSVLTYLFILSDVDPKMVGLKLFTSIDRFAGVAAKRLSAPLRRRRYHHLGRARHSVPTIDQPGHLCGRNQWHAAARA